VRPVRLAYKLYFFSQRTIFFSHNKSANNTFNHGLSAKRAGQCEVMTLKKLVKPSNIRPELVVHVKKRKED